MLSECKMFFDDVDGITVMAIEVDGTNGCLDCHYISGTGDDCPRATIVTLQCLANPHFANMIWLRIK